MRYIFWMRIAWALQPCPALLTLTYAWSCISHTHAHGCVCVCVYACLDFGHFGILQARKISSDKWDTFSEWELHSLFKNALHCWPWPMLGHVFDTHIIFIFNQLPPKFLYHNYFILFQVNLKHIIFAEIRMFQTLICDPSDFCSVILLSPNDDFVYLWPRMHGNKYKQNHYWEPQNSEFPDGVDLSVFHNILHLYTTVYF